MVGDPSPREQDETDCPQMLKKMPLHLEHETRYYKVVYRGVVALVAEPDSTSRKSGAYLSYGEVISSSFAMEVEEMEPIQAETRSDTASLCVSPPSSLVSAKEGSMSSLDTQKAPSSVGAIPRVALQPKRRVLKRAIRVDKVLTGGYAVDASDFPASAESHVGFTPKRSNANALPMVGPSPIPLEDEATAPTASNLGYIFATKKNQTIVEKLSAPPLCEMGRFLYQIVSSTPLPILTGPSLDAPRTRAMLLPGTVHEVCLRLFADGEAVGYLRLSHRKGWITDRQVSVQANGTKIGGIPAVKELSQAPSATGDDSSNSVPSMTSTSTPGSVARNRHRPPRRKRQEMNTSVDQSMRSYHTPTKKPSARSLSPILLQPSDKHFMFTPSSNISIHSDDPNESVFSQMPSSTPDRSVARSFIHSHNEHAPSRFLMRVNAPRGLKVLDAPHFQVNSNRWRPCAPYVCSTDAVFCRLPTLFGAKVRLPVCQLLVNEPHQTHA